MCKWIICLDSDDYLSRDALKTIAIQGEYFNPDMLLFGVRQFSKKNDQSVGKRSHAPLVLNRYDAFRFSFDQMPESKFSPAFAYFVGNIAFSAEFIFGIRFSTSLKIGEDQDFKVKALSRSNRCVVISDCLYNYRLRRGSLSHSGGYYNFS